jgi:endoglucanase
VLTIFGSKWNVFAIDLKNEPHGIATWEAKNPTTDWNRAAEAIAGHVAAQHPDFNGLFFVEGIDHPTTTGNRGPIDPYSKPWGGDFEGVRARPISLGDAALNDRVVYSPHVVRALG